MQTSPGHYYRLDLVLSGPLQTSSDWLPQPLSTRYPVDVVSVTKPTKSSDTSETWTRSQAVVRWKGDPGVIGEGDQIESDAGMMSPLPVYAVAVVVAVTDLGLTVVAPYAALPNYLLAAAILLGTLLLVRRIK